MGGAYPAATRSAVAVRWGTAKVADVAIMDIRTANHATAAVLETRRCRLLIATENLVKPCFGPVENWSETIDLAQAAAAHDISVERLRALPEATRCVTCQRDHNRYPPIRAFA